MGKILVGGNDNAAVLLQAYPVHELEEEQGLGLAEFAITDLVNNQARILRETVDQLALCVIDQSRMEPIFLFAIKIFYNSTADMFPYCWLIFAFYQSVGSCPFLNVPFMPPQRKHYFPMSRRPFLPPPTLIYKSIGKTPIVAIEVDGFHYHKKDGKQHERDVKKDSIFKKYGLPLLRFNTNGSREINRISDFLIQYISQ